MNESLLTNIKEILSSHIKGASANHGVCQGSTGMAILCGILYNQTNDAFFNSLFEKYINRLSDNISSVKDTGFKEGIAGIGWGVEWLSQNEILQNVNTDEVLADFDDMLYKTIVYNNNGQLSILNGDLGLMNYFLLRNESKNPGTHRFRKLVNRECITIIEDRISEYLIAMNKADQSNTCDNITLGDILKTMSPIYSVLNTDYESLLQRAISLTEKALLVGIGVKRKIDFNYALSLLYLATNFLYAAKKINSIHYQQLAKKFIAKSLDYNRKNKANFSPIALLNLLRSQILLYLYDKNDSNFNELNATLTLSHKNETTLFCINDWIVYIYGCLVADNTDMPYKVEELMFYE